MTLDVHTPSDQLTPEIIEQLKQPMDSARVKTRRAPGGGVVPYISGEDAINTANRIFNFAWSSQVGEIRFVSADERAELKWNPQTQRREDSGERKSTGIYFATVSVSACGITKMDVGRCICEGNAAEAHDMAIAGAVTDGLKRALRQFGDQFGNALYDKESDTFREALSSHASATREAAQPAWSNRAPAPAREIPRPVAPSAPAPTAATREAPRRDLKAAAPNGPSREPGQTGVQPPARPKFGRPNEAALKARQAKPPQNED